MTSTENDKRSDGGYVWTPTGYMYSSPSMAGKVAEEPGGDIHISTGGATQTRAVNMPLAPGDAISGGTGTDGELMVVGGRAPERACEDCKRPLPDYRTTRWRKLRRGEAIYACGDCMAKHTPVPSSEQPVPEVATMPHDAVLSTWEDGLTMKRRVRR